MAASLCQQFLYTGLGVLECSGEEWSGFRGGCAGCWNAAELHRKQLGENMSKRLSSVLSHTGFVIFSHQCVRYVLTSQLGSAKTNPLVCLGFSFIWTAASKHTVPYKYTEYLDPHVPANMEIFLIKNCGTLVFMFISTHQYRNSKNC